MIAEAVRTVRCAIYTRKSVEEGLEQEFNSLDAQRTSCEAYIRAHRGEGWVVLPDQYDDGGYSGATLQRPAFTRLMSDIRNGKIDMVVCYKIDRLSRRLVDFTDVFREFENRKVAFSCVTQEFNTATSMGRMCMNLLMAFAQFERETTIERVRDKIRETRKKGLWYGGRIPFGYRNINHRLVLEPTEAAIVRKIYEMYLETGSPKKIAKMLTEKGVVRQNAKSKDWTTVSVTNYLKSAVYAGLIKSGNEMLKGVHEAIVPKELWDKVQKRLAESSGVCIPRERRQSDALLAGLVRCGTCGSIMGFKWTRKATTGMKYGYYIDLADQKRGMPRCPVSSIPSGQLESVVESEVLQMLHSPSMVARVLRKVPDLGEDDISPIVANPIKFWRSLEPKSRREVIRTIISKITVYADTVDITVDAEGNKELIKEIKDVHADS